MIPISVEQLEALELAERYCGILASVERSYALGDDDAVAMIFGGIDPIELRLTQATVGSIVRLWKSIAEVRGGDAAPEVTPLPRSMADHPQSAAPPNVIALDPWSRKAPCG